MVQITRDGGLPLHSEASPLDAKLLSIETRPFVIPTHDPDELRTALIGDGHGDGQGHGNERRS